MIRLPRLCLWMLAGLGMLAACAPALSPTAAPAITPPTADSSLPAEVSRPRFLNAHAEW